MWPHLTRKQTKGRSIKNGSIIINPALWDWRLDCCLVGGCSDSSVQTPWRMLSLAKTGKPRRWSLIETKPPDVHSMSKILSITMRSLASDCWIQPPSADSSWRCWPDTSPYSEFVKFPTSFQTSGLYCFRYWWLSTFWRPGWIARFSKMICLNQFQKPRERRPRRFRKKALDLAVNVSQSIFCDRCLGSASLLFRTNT